MRAWPAYLGALALVCIFAAPQARPAPIDAGRVEEVSGSASASGAGGARTLAARDNVFIGDDVMTAALSRARLALGQDTVVRLGENASLHVAKYLLNLGGVLNVGGGAILLDKSPGKGTTRLTGPFGLIVVRGTRVFAGPSNGVIGVFVAHGTVELTSGGRTTTLHDGQGADVVAPGARPTPPKTWGAARVQAALASVE